jgi:hypothetical protein
MLPQPVGLAHLNALRGGPFENLERMEPILVQCVVSSGGGNGNLSCSHRSPFPDTTSEAPSAALHVDEATSLSWWCNLKNKVHWSARPWFWHGPVVSKDVASSDRNLNGCDRIKQGRFSSGSSCAGAAYKTTVNHHSCSVGTELPPSAPAVEPGTDHPSLNSGCSPINRMALGLCRSLQPSGARPVGRCI